MGARQGDRERENDGENDLSATGFSEKRVEDEGIMSGTRLIKCSQWQKLCW